jgi:hypothetical protein
MVLEYQVLQIVGTRGTNGTSPQESVHSIYMCMYVPYHGMVHVYLLVLIPLVLLLLVASTRTVEYVFIHVCNIISKTTWNTSTNTTLSHYLKHNLKYKHKYNIISKTTWNTSTNTTLSQKQPERTNGICWQRPFVSLLHLSACISSCFWDNVFVHLYVQSRFWDNVIFVRTRVRVRTRDCF